MTDDYAHFWLSERFDSKEDAEKFFRVVLRVRKVWQDEYGDHLYDRHVPTLERRALSEGGVRYYVSARFGVKIGES